jgi:hypothetical protein
MAYIMRSLALPEPLRVLNTISFTGLWPSFGTPQRQLHPTLLRHRKQVSDQPSRQAFEVPDLRGLGLFRLRVDQERRWQRNVFSTRDHRMEIPRYQDHVEALRLPPRSQDSRAARGEDIFHLHATYGRLRLSPWEPNARAFPAPASYTRMDQARTCRKTKPICGTN